MLIHYVFCNICFLLDIPTLDTILPYFSAKFQKCEMELTNFPSCYTASLAGAFRTKIVSNGRVPASLHIVLLKMTHFCCSWQDGQQRGAHTLRDRTAPFWIFPETHEFLVWVSWVWIRGLVKFEIWKNVDPGLAVFPRGRGFQLHNTLTKICRNSTTKWQESN